MMEPVYDTERNYDHEAALERATQLLDALVHGDITPELREKIRDWFVGDMSVNEKYCVLERLFMELEPNLEPDSHEYEQLRKICRRLGFDRRRRASLKHVVLRVAAVLVSAFALAGIGWVLRDMYTPQQTAAYVTVSTHKGDTKRVVLPDGSQVWLNESSTIAYDDDFSQRRMVVLDGEAFFEVTKERLSPFRVTAGEMVVEVLGTEFGVRGRAGEQISEVMLTNGSVRVAPNGREFIELAPDERLTYDGVANTVVIEAVEADTSLAWRVADLRMTDMPLDEALRRIGSYYGLDVTLRGHGSAGDLVNLDFDNEMPLRQILDVVSTISGGFEYEITTEELIITLR
jgi:ferric-dicitrate binding protein FerR (iron transport regulator)